MRLQIVPFSEEHLDAAAILLAARHREHRRLEPALPAGFEEPAVARSVVAALLAESAGFAALHDGVLAGYLLGAPVQVPPEHWANPFVWPAATSVAYAGHAVGPADQTATYQALYAALGGKWRSEGYATHDIAVATADQPALDAWFALGFGRFLSLSVRETGPVAHGEPGRPLSFRQATADDAAAVIALVEELFRTFDDPPIFMPALPATRPHLRERVRETLADPGSTAWLAVHDDRVLGIQIFETPTAARWEHDPIVTPARSLYLFMAATAPEARSLGVGAALLDRSMRWAHSAGFARCMLHFLPASRASFFWQRLGFRAYLHELRRTIDPRVMPADRA